MRRQFGKHVAPCYAVALMLLLTALVGCEKKPDPVVSRAQDPVYQEQLKSLRAEQSNVAMRGARLKAMMNDVRHRAKANLGATATDEQVEAEINAHPERYPAWKTLQEQSAEAEKAAQQSLNKARATIRDRILKEHADRDAAQTKK